MARTTASKATENCTEGRREPLARLRGLSAPARVARSLEDYFQKMIGARGRAYVSTSATRSA